MDTLRDIKVSKSIPDTSQHILVTTFINRNRNKSSTMLRNILHFTFAIVTLLQIMVNALPSPQDSFQGHSIVVHYTTSPYRDVIIQGRKNFQDE